MGKKYKVLGFDADDTLWVNEVYYLETEHLFYQLLREYTSADECAKELYRTEMKNIKLYGYGTKGFMLSMIETALNVSNRRVSQYVIEKIIQAGKEMMSKPVILIEGVKEVLQKLSENDYFMIIATKGDLKDQERKLNESGISHCFDHIEIMSDKTEKDYNSLLSHLKVEPKDFLMIGNSIKSDILPVLETGANAVHIPFHTTWQHEKVDEQQILGNYTTMKHITELPDFLSNL